MGTRGNRIQLYITMGTVLHLHRSLIRYKLDYASGSVLLELHLLIVSV